MKGTPIIFIMFSVVLLAVAIVYVSQFYGSAEWTWIANLIAGLVVLFMVLGLSFYTLAEWLGKR